MIAGLYSKATVVRSFSAIAIIFSLSLQAFSQSKITPRISCSFSSASFNHVMDFLSKSAGVDFVYSSNKIKISKQISLAVINKPFEEVLSLLGKDLNLDFKIEGRHVVIKGAVKKVEVSTAIASSKRFFIPIIKTQLVDTIQIADVATRVNPYAEIEDNGLRASDEYFRRHISKFQPYFDSTRLKHMPLRYIKALNRNSFHAGWFVSVGALVNDYSGGLEIQAGMRNLYAVISPSRLRGSGEFHGAYGLGTSFNLMRDFSLNLIYTRANVTRHAEDYFGYGNSMVGVLQYEQKIEHSQIKLMLQYAITRNISVKAGATFNQSKTNYLHVVPEEQIIRSQASPSYGNSRPRIYEQRVEILTVQKQRITNVWLGWEAGVSYKLNLLPRK